MEYKSQRLYRDARIFSIYEGTTQLQVVAAIRYITNGSYINYMREMLQDEVADEFKPLKQRIEAMVQSLEQAIAIVKEAGNQDLHDFVARRLYDMTAETMMSILIIQDATRCPELFGRSAQVYVRMAEANVAGHFTYVKNFRADDIDAFRAQ